MILTPVKCKSVITGKILDIKTNKLLYNAVVQIHNEQGKLIETLSLDGQSSFNLKVDCEYNYIATVYLKGYTKKTVLINKSFKNNEIITKSIMLKPIEEFVSTYGKKSIKTNVIYFDLDSDEIGSEAAIEINKVIGVLISYPNIKIEVASHTDSKAPDNYNLTLSQRRANSTVDYMISNGIDPNRLVAKGYGETKLVNKCSNGVPCTNAEHELNRRTEFNIIDE